MHIFWLIQLHSRLQTKLYNSPASNLSEVCSLVLASRAVRLLAVRLLAAALACGEAPSGEACGGALLEWTLHSRAALPGRKDGADGGRARASEQDIIQTLLQRTPFGTPGAI